ncbi:hypothetical protein Q0590_08435 [Rhodocytophaga aerolata]|uniref:DUF4926 domain-containing protein n=1 Tax=Rhodocytophaga aerolata TaxID=455078 RepID=A0ABT8R3N0_9BACT|nr:hypothetical protein [Rhodocytophaga aerolata]MDO1446276.1 hypothetical protein [Rhodocytophaga aerolata]
MKKQYSKLRQAVRSGDLSKIKRATTGDLVVEYDKQGKYYQRLYNPSRLVEIAKPETTQVLLLLPVNYRD